VCRPKIKSKLIDSGKLLKELIQIFRSILPLEIKVCKTKLLLDPTSFISVECFIAYCKKNSAGGGGARRVAVSPMSFNA